ncbi:MAG: protein kinase [Gemmataceae bacterium]
MRGTHPPDGALRDFALGRLGDPDDAAVEAHLAECPDCLARATDPGPPDTLVELLAAAAARPDPTPAPDGGPTLTLAAGDSPSRVPPRGFPGAGPGATLDGPDAPPAVLVGHPRYRPVRRLGVGGMGSVWLAEHAVMGRQVAVKVIRPELLARPLAAERFVREVRAAARLHHPNIVAAFDAEEAAGACLLVMEFVPGEPLSEVVSGGPLSVADACRVARDAARGLAHAHAAGLVHRDVKPSNLIRTPDGVTKVLDFGLVTDDDRPAGLTGDNVVMGTPDYIAPEQADDAHTADARADVYGLGCTLYHLLSGRVPFPGGSVLKKLDAHRTATADPLTGVPPALAAVVARMMARRPEDRFPSAAEVAEALEPFARGEVPELPRRPRRRVMTAVAVGILALAGVAVGVVAYEVRRGNEVITVETDDPDVEVTMRRNGEVIRIVDAKTKKTWELDAKNARLAPDGGDLTLDLPDGTPLVLRRAGAVVATIRRAPAAAPVPPTAAPVAPLVATTDVRPFRVFAGHHKTVREVKFAPDGKTLYSAGFDGFVRVWDVDGGREHGAFAHGVRLLSIALVDGGKLLLSIAHADRPPFRLRAWDTTSGKEVEGFPEHPATEHLCTVAPSPDGTTAATVALNGMVRLWDVAGRKLVRAFTAVESTPAYSVAWSPDGKLLAVTGDDGFVVSEVATGRRVHRVTALGGQTTIAFTPDGSHVLTAGWDGVVRAYARGTWQLDRTLTTTESRGPAGTHLTTAPDGRLLLAAHTAAVRVWDVVADRRLFRLVGDGLDSVTPAVSADGRRAAAGGNDGRVFVWELPPAAAPVPAAVGAAAELHRIPFAPTGWSAVSPDGAEFLAFTTAGGKREAVIFDTATGKETGRCPMPAGELVCAHFIPGSRDLLVSDDLRLGRHDRATGVKRADLFEVPVNSTFAPLPAGGSAAALWLLDGAGGYGRHRIVVRDLTTGAERFRLNPLHPGSILGMAPRFSPDGTLLATTDTTPAASAIRLWDAATGKLVRTIDVAGALGCGNAFSADGRELVADYVGDGGAGMIGRWAVATGEPVRAVPVPSPWPTDFSEYLLGGRVVGYRGDSRSAVRFVATATGAAFADYRPGGTIGRMAASADGRVMLFAIDAGLRVVRVPTPPGP